MNGEFCHKSTLNSNDLYYRCYTFSPTCLHRLLYLQLSNKYSGFHSKYHRQSLGEALDGYHATPPPSGVSRVPGTSCPYQACLFYSYYWIIILVIYVSVGVVWGLLSTSRNMSFSNKANSPPPDCHCILIYEVLSVVLKFFSFRSWRDGDCEAKAVGGRGSWNPRK